MLTKTKENGRIRYANEERKPQERKERLSELEKMLEKIFKKSFKKVLTKAKESDILFELSKKRTATNIEN